VVFFGGAVFVIVVVEEVEAGEFVVFEAVGAESGVVVFGFGTFKGAVAKRGGC